jgi:hypothetical protein
MSYLLLSGVIKDYDLNIYIDDKLLTTEIVTSGADSNYTLNFDNKGTYIVKMIIENLGIEQSATITVVPYTSNLPVVNVNRDDLKVYLSAKGRTNKSLNREVWPDRKFEANQGELTNFYFQEVNGWLKDENNEDYLKVSAGAQVIFNDYNPFDTVIGKTPKDTGLTIELDFKVSNVVDYDEKLISWLSYDSSGNPWTGFEVTGNRFSYYASGSRIVSLDIVENERIKLTYVIER